MSLLHAEKSLGSKPFLIIDSVLTTSLVLDFSDLIGQVGRAFFGVYYSNRKRKSRNFSAPPSNTVIVAGLEIHGSV
jgi:hypothetical protein